MPERLCASCGKVLPVPRSSGRPRTRCEECSPVRQHDVKRRAPHKLVDPVPVVVLPVDSVPSLLDSTRAALVDADRLYSVAGQAALVLAEQLVSGAHSGAGFAALVKQLHATMDVALDGARRVADPVDELLARRVRRGSA